LKFILLPDACSPEVSADFGFGDSPASNVWDCWNDLVLFEFSCGYLLPCLSYCALPTVVPYHGAPTVAAAIFLLEYRHAMLLRADHGDDALCYGVNVCTWESDNKIAALVCVLQSGTWAVRCVATGLVPMLLVQILLTTVLTGDKIYMATQSGIHPLTGPCQRRFFIVDLHEGV